MARIISAFAAANRRVLVQVKTEGKGRESIAAVSNRPEPAEEQEAAEGRDCREAENRRLGR